MNNVSARLSLPLDHTLNLRRYTIPWNIYVVTTWTELLKKCLTEVIQYLMRKLLSQHDTSIDSGRLDSLTNGVLVVLQSFLTLVKSQL